MRRKPPKVAGMTVDESFHENYDQRAIRVQEAMTRVITNLDPTGWRQSTMETPERVTRMFLDELVSGYYVDIAELLSASFDNEGYDGMVIVQQVPFYSLCEHHLLLIAGKAHVGYLPNGSVVGLSKLPRVINAFAKRLQLQERLTKQIADAIEECLTPKGVMVVLEAEHMCLSIRGVQKPGTITTTSAVRGAFADPSTGARDEFLRLIGK